MSITNPTFVLPDRETMLRKLKAVNPNPHYCERFYPYLLEKAGDQMLPEGVVMIIMLAISDYTQGMHSAVAKLIYYQMAGWIEAVTPDEQSMMVTKAFYAESQKRATRGKLSLPQ